MAEFDTITVGNRVISPIDWEMNPSFSFGTYESWGGRERVRDNNECVYYFFIDGWGDEPKLCLMERAVKHACIIAEIEAPQKLLQDCVDGEGKVAIFEKSFTINQAVKDWLIKNVLSEEGVSDLVKPIVETVDIEEMGPPLPDASSVQLQGEVVTLPSAAQIINDEDIAGVIRKGNFFDRELNPEGRFENLFVAGESPEVAVDLRTGLMWEREGQDIHSIRTMRLNLERVNKEAFAGFSDWRLPSMEEALSLLEPERNMKGLYLHPCFHKMEAFVFVNATRKPGGYWFVDFKQGRAFWSSGSIPGGFGRFVRTV
ncbi:DUF1566 domain-containing protein [Desulforhopalus vacuolatus]|uniref:Lcl C-terminal domain-containing protein n=1 Tax=Desulforhopalus vacuolatus TaxID=40414 RepID=UPI0019630A43|nr:DUF1566 domain-containing protein [Desulforhopalus vacuolatus]MBM9520464.1 DUF1566 domain-containing protein [Desulforhopalus vacuolatus]